MKNKTIAVLSSFALTGILVLGASATRSNLNITGATPASAQSGVGDREQQAIWKQWASLWNGDFDQRSVIAADFCLHAIMQDGSSDTAINTPDKLVQWIKLARGPFSGLKFTTQVGPLISEDHIVGRWSATGTYQGGIPAAKAPTGTIVTFSGADILRIHNGKIAEYWVSSDTMSLLAQLGVGQ